MSEWFRIDGHVHCMAVCSPLVNSWRPAVRREKIVHVLRAAFDRLDAIILTDHSTTAAYDVLARNEWRSKPILPAEYDLQSLGPRALRVIRQTDGRRLLVFKGEEMRTRRGDVLGWFIHRAIPGRLSPEETAAEIRRQGGLVVAPHPFCGGPICLGEKGMQAIASQLDAVLHDCTALGRRGNERAKKFAEEHGLPYLASSDAHLDLEVGLSGFEIPPDKVESAADGDGMVQAILHAIRTGNFRVWIAELRTIPHLVHLYLLQYPSYFLGAPLLH